MQRTKQLAPGVWRARIDSECGLVVNMFILASEGQVALIDTGFPHTAHQVENALHELGLSLEAVTDVFYTHTHIDHIGGGTSLAARWSVDEWLWEGTTPAFGDVCAHIENVRTPVGWPGALLTPAQHTAASVCEILAKPRTPSGLEGCAQLRNPRGVPFGHELAVGAFRLRCVDARGHGPYHCAWYEPERRWLFSGDVVLSVPTPLVVDMGDDVATWLSTLTRWEQELEVDWLLPGHGMPTKLVQPSLARSRAALERVYAVLAQRLSAGPVDVLSVAQSVLAHDPSRYAARTAVLLANVESLLATLQSRGVVSRDGVHWAATASLPAFLSLEA